MPGTAGAWRRGGRGEGGKGCSAGRGRGEGVEEEGRGALLVVIRLLSVTSRRVASLNQKLFMTSCAQPCGKVGQLHSWGLIASQRYNTNNQFQ